MRILVTPERLEALAGQFQQASNGLMELGNRCQGALASLDWEARQKAGVEGEVQAAVRQARALAERAGELARFLQDAARRFAEADRPALSVSGAVLGAAAPPPFWRLPEVRLGGLSFLPIPRVVLPAAGAVLGGLIASPWLQAPSDLLERVWNWLHGYGWKTNRERESAVQTPKGQLYTTIQRAFEKSHQRQADQEKSSTPPSALPAIPIEEARKRLSQDAGMQSPWRQVDAPIKSQEGQRSADLYRAVIEQFDVEHSHPGRYRPTETVPDTRCNIYAGDVMRAMGAPLPTKGELYSKNDPMTANATDIHRALEQGWGGWRRLDLSNEQDRQLLVDHLRAGKPAVASDPGHIAVLRPDHLPTRLDENGIGDLRIAQAGARNASDISLKEAGYGSVFNPSIYIHE